jgi:hypothetical protein
MGDVRFFFPKSFFLLTIAHPIMPKDANPHNTYKFTVSPQPNSNMRFSFTPVSPGEIVRMMSLSVSAGVDHHLHQTIDITVGPAANGLTTSSDRNPISPPRYSSGSSSVPKAAAPPYASTSSHQKPSLPPGVRPFDLMPSQLQRKVMEDFAQFDETVSETDDESEILHEGYNQLVCLLFSWAYQDR